MFNSSKLPLVIELLLDWMFNAKPAKILVAVLLSVLLLFYVQTFHFKTSKLF